MIKNKTTQMYKNFIEMLVKDFADGLVCYSPAGYGKTYLTLSFLKEFKVKYKYLNGHLTPFELYKILYDNRNSIIILDDIDDILGNDVSINLLKAVLWNNDNGRKVSYNSLKNTDYPSEFEFKGKVIILTNDYDIDSGSSYSFQALNSRVLKFRFEYSLQELKKIAIKLTDNDKTLNLNQKSAILDILDNIKPYHKFNLREYEMIKNFVKYDYKKAKQMYFYNANHNKIEEIFFDIEQETKFNTEEKIKMFKELTGMSRATFYRFRQKYLQYKKDNKEKDLEDSKENSYNFDKDNQDNNLDNNQKQSKLKKHKIIRKMAAKL